MKKIYLTWQQVDEGVKELVKQIKKSKIKFDGIYGVPRGGMTLCAMLSYRLDLPVLLYPTKKSLVVDDISDTGKTLNSFKDRKIATLMYTKWTVTKPNFTVFEKESEDSWITFPWEEDNKEQTKLTEFLK
jgi:hypoxanthine phosphoribosyltransferase